MSTNIKIGIVGLGYVGAPLAIELSKHFDVIGYDINSKRVRELNNNQDSTNEIDSVNLQNTTCKFTDSLIDIKDCTVYIVTVPTPIKEANIPNLEPIKSASKSISKILKQGDTIIYESTVYPGVTEEVCVPILEESGLYQFNREFYVGYSPERINPGDKVNTLKTVTKIVSGDCEHSLNLIDSIYSKITTTYKAPNIKVAEAAKVIENTQRDVNIGLMNELSAIFTRLNIDTHDVIQAAQTKWNFLEFYPGFVGGHCISVDPYYLTHKAQTTGYNPSFILAAREVNDQMPILIGNKTLQALSRIKKLDADTTITILGCTFKENVPDIRNSKVFDLIKYICRWGINVQLIDRFADPNEVKNEFNIDLVNCPNPTNCVILAVAHNDYVQQGWNLIKTLLVDDQCVVMDLKAVLDRNSTPSNITLIRP